MQGILINILSGILLYTLIAVIILGVAWVGIMFVGGIVWVLNELRKWLKNWKR